MFVSKKLSQMLRYAAFTMCALLFSVGNIWAQDMKVTGKVTDKSGEPIVGVYVLLDGTSIGTSTEIDGTFTLTVPSTGKLVFTSMGYKNATVDVNGRAVVNVVMEDDAVLLEDVVVTALGIKKDRKALGYSVTEMNSKELLKNKQTNVVNSLAGKVAGVNVTQSSGAAGSGSTIVIRGGNSASESRDNQPLFVVDGIIYDNSTPNGGNSGTDGVTKTNTSFSNRVMDINPEDIESMSVLKGAAAAALYGSRAADGVVLITTKKGSEGSVKVNFNAKYIYSWANRVPTLQNTYGRGYYNQTGALEDETAGYTSSWGEKITGQSYDNIANFFQGGNVFDESVSVSGGNKKGSFYLSASRYDQTGLVPTTGYDKTTVRFNGEQKYGILSVGANVAYSLANTQKTLTSAGLYDGGGNGTMTALYGWSRSDDMRHYLNDDGTKYYMFPTDIVLPAEQTENPYWILNKNKLTDKTERVTGAVNANVKVADWFDIMYRIGIDTYNTDQYTYIAPEGNVVEKYQNGRLSKSQVGYNYLTSNLMLDFHKTFGDFDLNLLLGQSTEATTRERRSQWGYDFQTEGTISFANIVNENKFFTESTTRKRLIGVYGEFRASWKNMIYLTVTGRNDWSSTLPVENRSYFYPSVSASFVFTELLPKNNVLTFGKIRGSWASVGKDADAYATNTYLWGAQVVSGSTVGVGNSWTGGSPYLKPEIQKSWEIGAELKFFNGRLGIDYTYYNSETVNQLCSPRLCQSTGYIFLTLNGGSVKNQGMELAITGTPIATRDFTWDMTLNLSGNRGTLGEFIDGVDIFYVTDAQIGGVKAGSIPNGGYFLGMTGDYWTREIGDNNEEIEGSEYVIDPATGLYKNTKATTNIVGNREPTFIGGFNNSLTYKGFNLSFLFDIRVGGDIYNGTEYYLVTRGLSERTLQRDEVTVKGIAPDGTTHKGDVNPATGEPYEIPNYTPFEQTYKRGEMYTIGGKQISGAKMIEDYWANYSNNSYNFITKTNWLRLRSLSLSYDFTQLISKQKVIKGLSATITGTNLWLWTNYKGMDPEVSVSGSGTGGSGSMGIDYCGVPATAGCSFGINLTF